MKEQLFKKILSLLEVNSDKGYSALDFGCGTGKLLGMMTNLFPDGSNLVGVDAIPESIETAKSQHPDVRFVNCKFVNSLPFPDHAFDVVLSIDAMECIPDKKALVNEFHRVLKPEGNLIVAHWDWDTQVYNSTHKQTLRKIVSAFSDLKQDWMDDVDGQMGRKLWALFEGSKKFHGRMEAFNLLETVYEKGCYGYDRMQDFALLIKQGQLSEDDYKMIRAEMETLNYEGKYFYSITAFIYCGSWIKEIDIDK